MKKMQWYGLFLLAFLSGCSVFNPTQYASSEKKQYMKSQNGPNLVVPQPLSTSNISDFYQLPDQTQPANVSIVPPK